jgi:hypothetical protein
MNCLRSIKVKKHQSIFVMNLNSIRPPIAASQSVTLDTRSIKIVYL